MGLTMIRNIKFFLVKYKAFLLLALCLIVNCLFFTASSPFSLSVFLSVVFIAPILEELFFRYFLYRLFSYFRISYNMNIIICSLIFALYHISYGSLWSLVYSFVFSLCSFEIYRKSNDIFYCIITHSLMNSITFLFCIL